MLLDIVLILALYAIDKSILIGRRISWLLFDTSASIGVVTVL